MAYPMELLVGLARLPLTASAAGGTTELPESDMTIATSLQRCMTAVVSLAALTILTAPAAQAQGLVTLGQLVCKGEGGIGLLIVSQKSFGCRFMPSGNRSVQRYTATVTNFGLDIGKTGNTTLVWTVLSSSNRTGPGMLSGTYAGAGANASIGVGGGGSLLVGGSNNTVSLQPLSGQVQTGLNIAAGIEGLTLRAR
jgi:Protein of unknown function (DUF992)